MRVPREEIPNQIILPAEVMTGQSLSGPVSRSISELVGPLNSSISFLVKDAQCQTTGLNDSG